MLATVSGTLTVDTLTVTGGDGGAGGNTSGSGVAGTGGESGKGGIGGSGVVGFGAGGGGGGGGGNATLNASGYDVTVSTALQVSSGSKGGNGTADGDGGGASFTVGTLIAPSITLTKNNGALSTNITTLDVGSSISGTTLTLSGTAASDVTITNVALNSDRTFTVSGTGAATITNLNVTGAGGTVNTAASQTIGTVNLAGGATLTDSGSLSFNTMNVQGLSASYTGTLNAANKVLNLDLTGASSSNTMLITSTAANIDGATVNLSNTPTTLQLGQSVTLISQTNGAIAASSATVTATDSQDATQTYALGGAGKLDAFLGKIYKDGDYTVTGPYSATAGAAAGQNVELEVTGTLTVAGTGVMTVASSANNSATLKAGTLDANSLTLNKAAGAINVAVGTVDATAHNVSITLDGTTAGNGTTGVKFDTVNLTGGNTFAVTSQNSGLATIDTLNVTGTGGTVNTAASQAIGTVNLAGGATLTDSGSLSFSTMNVQGVNATYDGDLVATGATINFDLPATLSQGNIFLTVTGNADLTGSTLLLKAQNPLTMLNANDDFTLVNATGTLTDGGFNGTEQQDTLGNKYNLSVLSDTLYATLADPRTFEEIIGDAFDGTGQNNGNLENGASYLDEISVPGVIDPGLAADIGNAFNDAIAAGGVGSVTSSRSTQQFFGAYSAYANQALFSDMNRFRRRWQGQNRYFFDTRLFGDLSTTVSESTGVASDSGLASPRYGARDTIACGQSRVWAGGFGTWAKQNSKSNYAGYKYDSQGAVLGYEYSIGNLNLGLAAAYSRGDLKVNDLRYKNEADVLNLALYGAYIHESGFYAEGGFGYGHAWNDYKVDYIAAPGGVKKAKYGSDTFTADLELGYIARLPRDFNLIPSVGVEYTYLKNGSWTESVNNPTIIANRFHSDHDNGLDIPLGLRFNKMFRFGCDGGFIVPEVRAAYVYSANKSRPSIDAGFAGAPGGAKMVGVDPGRSHWRVGAGLSGRVNSRVDFRIDYEFETRSGFKGHNLNASVGLSF